MTKAHQPLNETLPDFMPFRTPAFAVTRCFFLLFLLTLCFTGHAQLRYLTNKGSITITGYTGIIDDLTIPETINGFPVRDIRDGGFEFNSRLKSVIIPDSVTNIGFYAFSGCTGLMTLKISNKLIIIGDAAFSRCTSLKEVTIPNSVTRIGTYAFASCTTLKSMRLPNALTSIWEAAFADCTGLTNLTIPKSVTIIKDGAFRGCTSLTSVIIPSSVTSIGTYVFDQSSNLKSVYFQGNQPKTGVQAFGTGKTTIYYLPGTLGWNSKYAGLPAVLWNPQPPVDGADFGIKTGQFAFNITGSTNIEFLVEACDDLSVPVWLSVGTNTLVGGSSFFSDPSWTNHPSRMYRFRSP